MYRLHRAAAVEHVCKADGRKLQASRRGAAKLVAADGGEGEHRGVPACRVAGWGGMGWAALGAKGGTERCGSKPRFTGFTGPAGGLGGPIPGPQAPHIPVGPSQRCLQRHSPLMRTVTPWSQDTRCSSWVSLTYTAKSGTDAAWPPRAALSASSSSTVAAAAPLPLLPPLRARDRALVGATSNAADPPLLM